MEMEYIKSMHSNYARILLEEKPDEKKYQYCIVSRGGIKGLLPCSLRYIDNESYLYYDITSRQNVAQMFKKRRIDRRWMKDFMWSLKEIQLELDRFLLDDGNILWFPEHVYQDLENNVFLFMYMPYYDGENGFIKFLDFVVENLDYDDEGLVECAYRMYGKYEENGDVYLQGHIFEDARLLDENDFSNVIKTENNPDNNANLEEETEENDICLNDESEYVGRNASDLKYRAKYDEGYNEAYGKNTNLDVRRRGEQNAVEDRNRKKIFSLFDKKARMKEEKYRQMLQIKEENQAVAEDVFYEGEEAGRTFYMDSSQNMPRIRRLYTSDERVLAVLGEESITIGKYREEVDVVIGEPSMSRIHARISKEGENYYLEDMNSTNGTFKNGIRMQPYEKKKLMEGDEIMLGKVTIFFR